MEYIYKDEDKEAVSVAAMGAVKERHGERMGERILTITTRKGYKAGTLKTEARVNWHYNGGYTHAFGLGSGGDYGAEILVTPCARVTKKAICTQHANASKDFQKYLEAAKAYYEAGKDAI